VTTVSGKHGVGRARAAAGVALAILAGFGMSSRTVAESLTGREIVERADRNARAKTETVKISMELITNGEVVSRRELVWYFRNDANGQVSLMKFLSPASVRSVGVLTSEDKGRGNTTWQYLPATRAVRRISAEHKQNRFMGTEFVYEDFEGMKLAKYDFTLLKTAPCGDHQQCDVVEARASDSGEMKTTGYGKKRYWIDGDQFFLVKTELFNKEGQLSKVVEGKDFRSVDGYWRSREELITNLKTNGSTRLIELDRKMDGKLDPYYVSQQYLRAE